MQNKKSIGLIIWCKQSDRYLIDRIQREVGQLNIIKILNFQDIITYQQSNPIIFLSTAMDRAIQSYDKLTYQRIKNPNLSNILFKIQMKNRKASYYDSLFQQVSKVRPKKSFILNLSIDMQCKLCFKERQEKQQIKKIFQVIDNQILKFKKIQDPKNKSVVMNQTNSSHKRMYEEVLSNQSKYRIGNDTQIQSLKQQINGLISQNQQLKENLIKKSKQNPQDQYRTSRQLLKVKKQLQIVQNQLNQLMQQRLNKSNLSKEESKKLFELGYEKKELQIRLSIANRNIQQKNQEILELKEFVKKLNNNINEEINKRQKLQKLLKERNNYYEVTKPSKITYNNYTNSKSQSMRNLQREYQKIKQLNSSYEKKLKQQNNIILNQDSQLKDNRNRIKQLQSQIEMLKKTRANVPNNEPQLLSKIRTLQNMVNNLESQNNKLKQYISVLQNKSEVQGSRDKKLTFVEPVGPINFKNKKNQGTINVPKEQTFQIIKKIPKPWYLIVNIPADEQICKQIHRKLKINNISLIEKIYTLNDTVNFEKQDRILFLNLSNFPIEKKIITPKIIENTRIDIRITLKIIQIIQKLSKKQKHKQTYYGFCRNAQNYEIPIQDSFWNKKTKLYKPLFSKYSLEFETLLSHLKQLQK